MTSEIETLIRKKVFDSLAILDDFTPAQRQEITKDELINIIWSNLLVHNKHLLITRTMVKDVFGQIEYKGVEA